MATDTPSATLPAWESELDKGDGHAKQDLNFTDDDRRTTYESLPDVLDCHDEYLDDEEDWEQTTQEEISDPLQASVDRIFKTGAASLLDSSFSLAIADAHLEGCPLIGCSAGFTSLCGYEMADVVGFSCRFLVDPVLSWEQVAQSTRRHCRDFCSAAKEGKKYRMPSYELHGEWLPEERPSNELILVQSSTHKDGWLFTSMFLMKIVSLGDFDHYKNYIIALQAEVPGRRSDLTRLRKYLEQLDKNMAQVMQTLGKEFITSGAMYRQYKDDDSDLDL